MKAQLVTGGAVWGHPEADAILLAGGQIAAVGRAAELADADAERVEATGCLVLPGFVDGHTHLVESGLAVSGFTLDAAGRARDDTLAMIAAAARTRDAGEWLILTGWDESRWPTREPLCRLDLDRLAGRAAVVAVRVDGHVAVLSSAAWSRARAVLEGRPKLIDATTGEVREEAVERVCALARPDGTALRDAVRAASRLCHRLGLTTVHVMSGATDPALLFEMAAGLRLRMVIHPPVESLASLLATGARTGHGDAWARWGAVKLFADGSVGARNAAFAVPYRSGGRGTLLLRAAQLVRWLETADRSGWQTAVHAIGDRAIAQVLRAHRAARTDPGLGHRIEHYEFPAPREVEATRALGLAVCMQPNFIGNWSGSGGLYETALGARRDAACNPLRAVLAAGIPLGFGSDGMPLGPLYGIACAMTAPHPGQRLTADEAISAYTAGAASLVPCGPGSGTLQPGAAADVVVVDGPLEGIGDRGARVVATWVAGERVTQETEAR